MVDVLPCPGDNGSNLGSTSSICCLIPVSLIREQALLWMSTWLTQTNLNH